MVTERLHLGQKVRWRGALYRATVERSLADLRTPIRREWRWHPGGEWREGYVVGWRTLYDGKVVHHYEEPTEFLPERHFTAYLIAFDPRTNPVYVLPENVEPL